MKKQTKRWGLTALSLCMATGVVLAGCGKEAVKTNSATDNKSVAEDKYAKLPKEVSISTFDRGQVSSDEGTYEENRWVKWIREQSGINVKVVPVVRNQAQEKLNILIASKQAPDLIWEYDRNYIGTMVTQGAIQPIDEYIEKYSTSYKKYLQENPDLKPYVTFDGKTYAATTKRAINTVANHGMWIRQDWLDKLKLKTPTTIDELIEVAKAFKDSDPDGNGKPDTTPIVGQTTFDIYSAMNGVVSNDWYLENGKMKYGPTTDRFGDVIAFEKKVYELGLVDKEYFTDRTNQRATQLWTTGKAGILMWQWSGGNIETMMKDLWKNVSDAKPVPLEPVSTKNGKFGLYQETPAYIYVTFNKDIKNPKAAVEYLDWMVDKGWKSLAYGAEGVHHRLVNGVPQYIDFDKYKKEALYANDYAVLRPEKMKPEDLLVRAASDPQSQAYAQLAVKSLETATKNKFRRDFPYQPSFTEINEIKPTLKTFLEEIRAKTITGKDNTGEWALGEIRKEWKRVGGEKAEQKAQEWYDKNKDSFK